MVHGDTGNCESDVDGGPPIFALNGGRGGLGPGALLFGELGVGSWEHATAWDAQDQA